MSSLPPALRLSQMIVGLWVPQAVHAAADLRLADALGGGPLPSHVVAERLGTHPDATDRLMRALVTLGLLAKREDEYELTELGRCLESGSPASRRAWSRLMGSPAVWQAWGRLAECVRTGRKAYGAGGAGEPEADTFDALAADPEAAAVFHQAMAEMTLGVAPAVAQAMDLEDVRTVVDVGGGHGVLLCAILDSHPGVEGAVFDLPHARNGALELFASRGLAGRARYVAGSFFETAPPPADAYVLKSVIHDWDDARSLAILTRCRDAMKGSGRLFLVEPPAGGLTGDPVGDWFLAFSDLNMLVNTGGRERAEPEYARLLERAGLKVSAVRETRTFYRVFEAAPA